MADIVEQLRQAAQQIADEGHDGWGNTCAEAADEIASLRAQVAALEVGAGRYKYLRDVAWETGSLIFYAERYGPEDWDAHIDAALAARKGAA